jgi:hypothetical protein
LSRDEQKWWAMVAGVTVVLAITVALMLAIMGWQGALERD